MYVVYVCAWIRSCLEHAASCCFFMLHFLLLHPFCFPAVCALCISQLTHSAARALVIQQPICLVSSAHAVLLMTDGQCLLRQHVLCDCNTTWSQKRYRLPLVSPAGGMHADCFDLLFGSQSIVFLCGHYLRLMEAGAQLNPG